MESSKDLGYQQIDERLSCILPDFRLNEDNELKNINDLYAWVRSIDHVCNEKYKSKRILGKKEIYKLLYVFYDLSGDYYSKTFEFRPSKLNFRNRYVNLFYKSKNELNENDERNLENIKTPSKTIKEHVRVFLDSIYESKYSVNEEPLVSRVQYEGTIKYTVPYLDSICFLLYFIYQDGRAITKNIFENENARLPNFKRKNSCSKFSQKIVFKNILSLFNILNTNEADSCFEIAELYRMNQLFKLFKIHKLVTRYCEFLSNDNLERIFNEFDFTYTEAMNFNSIIIDKIFKNKSFIEFCLKCDYFDPFLVFSTLFKKYIVIFQKNKKDNEWLQSMVIDEDLDNKNNNSGKENMFENIIINTLNQTFFYIDAFEEKTKRQTEELFKGKKRSEEMKYCNDISKRIIGSKIFNEYFFNNRELLRGYCNEDESWSLVDSTYKEYFDYLCDVSRNLLPKSVFSKKKTSNNNTLKSGKNGNIILK